MGGGVFFCIRDTPGKSVRGTSPKNLQQAHTHLSSNSRRTRSTSSSSGGRNALLSTLSNKMVDDTAILGQLALFFILVLRHGLKKKSDKKAYDIDYYLDPRNATVPPGREGDCDHGGGGPLFDLDQLRPGVKCKKNSFSRFFAFRILRAFSRRESRRNYGTCGRAESICTVRSTRLSICSRSKAG